MERLREIPEREELPPLVKGEVPRVFRKGLGRPVEQYLSFPERISGEIERHIRVRQRRGGIPGQGCAVPRRTVWQLDPEEPPGVVRGGSESCRSRFLEPDEQIRARLKPFLTRPDRSGDGFDLRNQLWGERSIHRGEAKRKSLPHLAQLNGCMPCAQ